MPDNILCGVLELGISGKTYENLVNIFEDHNIRVVKKDYMSIIIDVFDEPVVGHSGIELAIYSHDVELSTDGEVLFGSFKVGEAKSEINSIIDGCSEYHCQSNKNEDENNKSEELEDDELLTFVIAEGDFTKTNIDFLNGIINTSLKSQPLTFDEGDITNMTMNRLQKFHIE